MPESSVVGKPSNVEIVRSYATSFRVDEDPISEGGLWLNGRTDGLDWANVLTRGGLAHAESIPMLVAERRSEQGDTTEAPEGDYNDPAAILKGAWGRNQYARARVHSRNQTPDRYHEVELRLRSGLFPHQCPGYEVFFRCLKTDEAYAEIVRWDGPLGAWTSLCRKNGAEFGVKDGDIIEATIIGDVIKGYINGVEVTSTTDETYPSGAPGIGFNYGAEESAADHGLTYFETVTWDG
jgi:hypothetical protein